MGRISGITTQFIKGAGRAGKATSRTKSGTRKAGDYFAKIKPKTKPKTKKPKNKTKTSTNTPKSKSKGGVYRSIGNLIKEHPIGAGLAGLYGYSALTDVGRDMNQDLYDQVVGAGGELEKGLPTQIMQGLGLVHSDERIKEGRVDQLEKDLASQIGLIEKHGGTVPKLTFDMTAREAASALSVPLYDAQQKQRSEDYNSNPEVIEARTERDRQIRLEEEAMRRQAAREDFLMNEQVLQRMDNIRRQRNESMTGLAAVFAALAAG